MVRLHVDTERRKAAIISARQVVQHAGDDLKTSPPTLIDTVIVGKRPSGLAINREGDMALVAVANILREQIRSRDLAARLGGDEFALYVEDIGLAAAEQKGCELISAAEVLKSYSGDPDRPLGLSIGIAMCDPSRGETPDALIERADQAMYAVKRHGKGGVSTAPPPRRGKRPL